MNVSECVPDSGTKTDDAGEAGNNNSNNNNNNDAQLVPKIMVNWQTAFYAFYFKLSLIYSQNISGIISCFSLFLYRDYLHEGGILKISFLY